MSNSKTYPAFPTSFFGWSFVSDNPKWKHFGEVIVIDRFNATDSSYYDCIALDGSCPAVGVQKVRDMFLAGKLTPPAA